MQPFSRPDAEMIRLLVSYVKLSQRPLDELTLVILPVVP
jgi:hypothetical protein